MSRRRLHFAAHVAVAFLTVSAGCSSTEPEAEELVLYAAASTQPIVDELARAFELERGIRVTCNYAASSTLANQIRLGAPADVFLSAHVRWMDDLEQHGDIDPDSRRDLFANGLAVIVHVGDGTTAPPVGDATAPLSTALGDSLAGATRIAVGDPDYVPLGLYTQEALEAAGAWNDELRSRLVPAPDARAALRLVEMRAVDAGVVYASDAAASDVVEILVAVPERLHDPIRYPVAACRGAGAPATAFMQFLESIDLDAVARRHHFRPVTAPETP